MDAEDDEVDAFFDLMATDYAHLSEQVRQTQPENQQALQTDFTVFRTYPLVYTRDEQDIATCIDSGFLQEKIAHGLYHTILKSLEGENDRTNFLRRYWGDVFEIYVNERFTEVLSPKEFLASPMIDRPNTDEQLFDGVLLNKSNFLAMEYKGKYLTLETKYSGNRPRLIAELEEKFGLGVRQLANGIAKAFSADHASRVGFSQRDHQNNLIRQLSPDACKRFRRIYPVLIVQDFSLALGFANYHLREMFETEIAKYQIGPMIVRPLSLITIEDLEVILPYLKQVGFAEILEHYIKRIEPAKQFQGLFSRFVRKRKLRKPETDKALARMDEIIAQMKSSFRVIE